MEGPKRHTFTIQEVIKLFERELDVMRSHPDKATITKLTILAGTTIKKCVEI